MYCIKTHSLGVQWKCFVRCVEVLLVTNIQSRAVDYSQLFISNSAALIVAEYLSMIEIEYVSITCVHLFESLFFEKEKNFPSLQWPDKNLLLGNENIIWGNEFKIARAKHHAACNEFIDTFIQDNMHLIKDLDN